MTMQCRLLPDDSYFEEEAGLIKSAHLAYMVWNVTGDNIGDILANARGHGDIPLPGEPLCAAVPYVKCKDVSPRYKGKNPSTGLYEVRVDVDFISHYTDFTLSVEGGSSLTQLRTQLYRDQATPIEVTYTPSGGSADTKRAEVTVNDVQGNYQCRGAIATNDPESVKRDWEGCVNSDTFRGRPARTWIVSQVRYSPLDRLSATKVWMFEFQLDYNASGWRYLEVYRDADGNIPEDVDVNFTSATNVTGAGGVVLGRTANGITEVYWHEAKAFSGFFA
jgi:hypothetical protein